MSLLLPTLLPSQQEIRNCESFQPGNISVLWKDIPPKVIRTLIYRAITGSPGWDRIKDNLIYQGELLVISQLNPPVWAVTRNLENQEWLHNYGVCLGCKKEIDFSAGAIYPIISRCLGCQEIGASLPDSNIFQYSMITWPVDYQLECIDYIINLIKAT